MKTKILLPLLYFVSLNILGQGIITRKKEVVKTETPAVPSKPKPQRQTKQKSQPPQESLTDNPRGIYKLTRITDEEGNGSANWSRMDQYQICTDSVTVILGINGAKLNWWDHTRGSNATHVLNYTGKREGENDKYVRVFDSNSERFTLKWWSEENTANGFAKDTWYTEHYMADLFSNSGKVLFDAISGPNVNDPSHPLYGTWIDCGLYKSMEEAQKCTPAAISLAQAFNSNRLMVCTPTHLIFTNRIVPIQTNGTDFIANDRVYVIQNNCMIIEAIRNQETQYYVFHRTDSPQSVLSHILSHFKQKGK